MNVQRTAAYLPDFGANLIFSHSLSSRLRSIFMSPPQIGYIKSIYGIIADSIKEEIKILKSDYFAYQPRLRPNFEILNARGMGPFKSLTMTGFMSDADLERFPVSYWVWQEDDSLSAKIINKVVGTVHQHRQMFQPTVRRVGGKKILSRLHTFQTWKGICATS